MKIQELDKLNRPREKLLRYGPNRLSNSELLAIILGSGKKGINVIELAKKLLIKFSKNQLINISVHQLTEISGIGRAKACTIIACFELGKRLLKDKQTSLILTPKDIWQELREIRHHKKEYFIVFYLDVKNQIIKKEVISVGSLNASLVHPREVFEPAVRYLSAQIILAHNHPSGVCQPSEEDIELTERLVSAGKILGIEITDHIIITHNDFYSFRQNHLIST